jgi:Short C-terminal domain
LFHQGDTKSTISIADELGKLAKLKEQGVITEEEFLQLKSNLMKKHEHSVADFEMRARIRVAILPNV